MLFAPLKFSSYRQVAGGTTSAYSRSGTRDTLNTSDGTYHEEDPALLVSLAGDTSSGYAGTVSVGILEGTIYGG